MELPRLCLDCPTDISHFHGNTKRCIPCSAEYHRLKDREKKRELLQDDMHRLKERARQRQARAEGRIVQVRRTPEERAARTCADCGVNIGDAARNVKLCVECRGKAILEKSREASAKQRQNPKFREARKEYRREWISNPETHRIIVDKAKERRRSGIPRRQRRERYAKDHEYRRKVLAYHHNEAFRSRSNKRRRERYAIDADYRLTRTSNRKPWFLTPDEILAQLARQKMKCGICGKRITGRFHLDHILPIAKGGSSTTDNMQITHPRCNLRKNAKMLYFREDGQGMMALGK